MFERISVCKLMITMSQKPKGRPVRKIVSDHFVPVEKVKNNSNRYFFKCNYCSASIKGCDDNHLKHLIDQKTCPKAPDAHPRKCSWLPRYKERQSRPSMTISEL